MKDYMITDDTLAICPNGKGKATIIEKNSTFDVEISPRTIINKNSLMYGSSLDGRLESTNYHVGRKYKQPLVISEINDIILFPTRSPRLRSCIWINFINIKNILKDSESNRGIIEFSNGILIDADISFYILNNQYNNTLRLVAEYKKKHLN